ncbi:hypothetical protein [Paenibacillus daejeonensis]|uniref:hypothetical protein n=1 Tax=Paenibacillus daejeonensis TaxID=135193 RepID=UPI00035E4467|nr:hypothetical protein [Paenibacillus daejeonensis]
MKWGSLIAGGVIGIAAAAVIARRRPGALHLVGDATCALWRGIQHRAMANMFKKDIAEELSTSAPAPTRTANGGASAAGISTLEQLVATDPVARRETEKILDDNGLNHP